MQLQESNPEASPFSRHLPALDGLRGIAALGVVAAHVFPGNPHNVVEKTIKGMFDFGHVGVDLFFVLSGFLITGILYDSLPGEGFFRNFYARRALRIFPLYYGVLAVTGIVGVVWHLKYHRQLLSLALYLQNTSVITIPLFRYLGPTGVPLNHFWTLAIEEQFYLVWPVLVFLLRKRSRLLACCGFFFVFCPLLRAELFLRGVFYFRIHETTLCRADTLLAGAALALLLRSRFHDGVLRAGWWILAAGILGLICNEAAHIVAPQSPNASWHAALVTSLYDTVLAVACTGLLALTLRSPMIKGFFQIGALRSLGKYSYGIYVYHLILFAYLDVPMRKTLSAHMTSNKDIDVVLSGVLCFVLTVVVAYVSYRWYEKPFLRLKRYFEYSPSNAVTR